MFNPLKMAGDMKGMEKMLKPALEKFMNDSGFIKKSELKKLEERVESLERAMLKSLAIFKVRQSLYIFFFCSFAILNLNNMTWFRMWIDDLMP